MGGSDASPDVSTSEGRNDSGPETSADADIDVRDASELEAGVRPQGDGSMFDADVQNQRDGSPSTNAGGAASSGTHPGAPLGECSARCDDSTCKAALGTRAECNSKTDQCETVDCGRTVSCEDTSSALYCDIETHSCHRSNGLCGTVGQTTYSCPDLAPRLPAGISVSCDLSGGSGVCNLHTTPASAPLPPDLEPLVIASPADGTVFTDASAVVFTYDTPLAHFLLVTETLPSSIEEVTADAIWGIALPANPNGSRRVRWSDGFAIEDSAWLGSPGDPPPGHDLFAMIVAVNGSDSPVAGTPKMLRFRVGSGWAVPGASCSPDAGTVTCVNPVLIMDCFSEACALLCLKDTDCQGNEHCDFSGALPHCAAE